MKPNFSICVIAKNEAKTLPDHLLPSIKPFIERGGDALVVDTGSEDATVQTALQAGCRVLAMGDSFCITIDDAVAQEINARFRDPGDPEIVRGGERVFDFSAARNFASGEAANDVILALGCDESLHPFDIDKLCGLIAEGRDAMNIRYVHSHDPTGRPTAQFRREALYNRTKSKWTCVVHEVLTGDHPKYDPPDDVITIHHWQRNSANRACYLPGLALDCLRNPNADRQAHYFARELMYSGRYKSAILAFNHHLALPEAWNVERGQSKIYIGDCCQHLGFDTLALEAWHGAFVLDGTRREPLMRMAYYFDMKKERLKACACAAAALVIPLQTYYCNQIPYYREAPTNSFTSISTGWGARPRRGSTG